MLYKLRMRNQFDWGQFQNWHPIYDPVSSLICVRCRIAVHWLTVCLLPYRIPFSSSVACSFSLQPDIIIWEPRALTKQISIHTHTHTQTPHTPAHTCTPDEYKLSSVVCGCTLFVFMHRYSQCPCSKTPTYLGGSSVQSLGQLGCRGNMRNNSADILLQSFFARDSC